MIYELRVYDCLPGRLPTLIRRFADHTLALWGKHGIRQAGFFTTMVGESNQRLTYFLAWVPVVHRRFLPASHWTWLTRDVAAIVLPAVAMALLLRLTLPFPDSRLLTAVELGMAGVAVLMAAAAGSDWIRSRLMDLLANGRR